MQNKTTVTKPDDDVYFVAKDDLQLPVGGGANKRKPEPIYESQGWDEGLPFDASSINYIFNNHAQWLDYIYKQSPLDLKPIHDAINKLNTQVEAMKIKIGGFYFGGAQNPAEHLFYGAWSKVEADVTLRSAATDSTAAKGTNTPIIPLLEHDHTASSGAAGSHNHTASSGKAGKHTHAGSASSAGVHKHTGNTNISGNHTHTYSSAPHGRQARPYDDFAGTEDYHTTQTTSASGNHSHTLSIKDNGAHTHNVTVAESVDHDHPIAINGVTDHTHTITVSKNGIANATLDVRGKHLDVVIWKRTA